MRLAVGEHNFDKIADDYVKGRRNNIYRAEQFHVHPNYNYRTSEGDIALVRTQRSINFDNDLIKPICLPGTRAEQYINDAAVAVGKYNINHNPQLFSQIFPKCPT